jgi:hypothetical protein
MAVDSRQASCTPLNNDVIASDECHSPPQNSLHLLIYLQRSPRQLDIAARAELLYCPQLLRLVIPNRIQSGRVINLPEGL